MLTLASSLSTQINNAATIVAVALGVLTLFTSQRLSVLATARKDLGGWTPTAVVKLLPDAGLALLTVATVISIAPLVVSSWPPHFGRQNAVMGDLLLIAEIGLLALAAVQFYALGVRVCKHTTNS